MSTFLPQSASTPVNTSSDCPLGQFVHILMGDQQQHHEDFLIYKLQMYNWKNSVLHQPNGIRSVFCRVNAVKSEHTYYVGYTTLYKLYSKILIQLNSSKKLSII